MRAMLRGHQCSTGFNAQLSTPPPSIRMAYNTVLVYCRELAPGTVSLTGDQAQGDDNKHDSHYSVSKDNKQPGY